MLWFKVSNKKVESMVAVDAMIYSRQQNIRCYGLKHIKKLDFIV
jgi:hypothetical protein